MKLCLNEYIKSTTLISLFALFLLIITIASHAQVIPSPKEHFGFNIGDDYSLATYSQTESYFKKLAVSDRTKLIDIGLTEEGRHQYMLVISSPENIRNLSRYKEISQKLARAEGMTVEEARTLANEGKSVVWIDGGLHGTEVVGSHQLIETAWQLVSRSDKETLEILDDVIILMAEANPDGQELVSSWYMRETDPKKRRMNIPRLYQKYVGHDNNRDFYLLAMKESQNINRQFYLEWMPQILYDHHQSGPAGSVLAGPPYRDPFNYVYDPLLITSLDAIGAAMNNRLNSEGKPGYTQRNGSPFSTWYNGSLRTTAYFHNMIGILTEIIGSPTPSEIPLVPDRLIPNSTTPNPVTPQKWQFRQSIDYSVSLNYAVLYYASRYRNELLYNICRMGMNSIDRGSSDYWTLSPKAIDAIKNSYKNDPQNAGPETVSANESEYPKVNKVPLKYYSQVFKDSARRDARAYIIPAGQEDFPTAVTFINALIGTGIQVQIAVSDFIVNGKMYPVGSYIVKTAQAFRPHIIDMFEPQNHPNDLQYAGGPPIPPYDAAGWTLAFQMGIKFDRILENLDGPFQKIPYGEIQPLPRHSFPSHSNAGYLLSPSVNNSFKVVNDMLQSGVPVYRVAGLSKTQDSEPGTFYIPPSAKAKNILLKTSSETGVKVTSVPQRPKEVNKILPTRVAIWNRYGGLISAGWISWIFEQYHFTYKMIYSHEIDSGNLRKKYDVIIFAPGTVLPMLNPKDSITDSIHNPKKEEIPEEFHKRLGKLTAEKSIPELQKFMEEGGTIYTLGNSTNLAFQLKIPVIDALLKINDKGKETKLNRSEYYIPGSILRVVSDTTEPANWGMPSRFDIYFEKNPVFRFKPEAAAEGVKSLMWFSDSPPLQSGWALGQEYLKNCTAAFVAPVGKGKFYAFGPDITFRAQSQSTFKLLFNQLYLNTSK